MIKRLLTIVILSIALFTFASAWSTPDVTKTEWIPLALQIDTMIENKAQEFGSTEARRRFYVKVCDITQQMWFEYKHSFNPGEVPYTSLQQQVMDLACKRESDYERLERETIQPLRGIFNLGMYR